MFLYFAFLVLDYPLNPTEIREGDHFFKTFAFRTYQVFVIVALTWVIIRFVDFIGLIFKFRAEKTPPNWMTSWCLSLRTSRKC